MSSHSGNTTKDWRDLTSTQMRQLAGVARRVAVRLTSSAFWQTIGHLLLDNTTQETADAEVFSGIGYYARPPAGANAEAIQIHPGGPANPVLVAMRDEATRKKVAGAALQDETFVYNSKVAIRLTSGGRIQAYLVGGPAPVQLALKSDVDAVVSAHNGHTHPGVSPGAASTGLTTNTAPAATGSSVLMG